MPSWVYAINSKNTQERIYIGSTTGKYFCLRKGEHTRPSTTKYRGNSNNLYGYIHENGGWDQFVFEILKEYIEIDKKQLLLIEKEYIETLNPKCNIIRPIRTYEEHLENAREKGKRYRQKHPEYNEKNKARESHKRYVEKRCSTKIECECGGRYTLQNKTNHFSRQIHKKYEDEKGKA
jgi:hypothetical protein